MGSEHALWQTTKKHLQGHGDFTRHEDAIGVGIPDVSYGMNDINGWIELKYSPDFPKRDATPVRLRHFTPEQRDFLKWRGHHGGYCWVLWQIAREYYLFSHLVVAELGHVPKARLLEIAYRHWSPRLTTEPFIEALQERVR